MQITKKIDLTFLVLRKMENRQSKHEYLLFILTTIVKIKVKIICNRRNDSESFWSPSKVTMHINCIITELITLNMHEFFENFKSFPWTFLSTHILGQISRKYSCFLY